MKNHLRIALPPLAQLNPEYPVAFALFNARGKLLKSGIEPVQQLAARTATRHAQAILHPGDAVVAEIHLPPLPTRKRAAAVQARVEPMTLSELDALCIAHGPLAADGSLPVAWADRHSLVNAWRILDAAGLKLDAIVPLELALPEEDPTPHAPLTLPVDHRWQAPIPGWSLAQPAWRPRGRMDHWRGALRWTGAAALLWLAGLQLYAAQLKGEVQAVQARQEQAVRAAFPSIGPVIAPLQQVRNQLDMLRLDHGIAGQDDFMLLALESAHVLHFAAGHVDALRYQDGQLTLTLAEGYVPPSDETALQRAATARSLTLHKNADSPHIWHISRAGTVVTTEQHR